MYARISQTNPRALAVCDRCGMLYNHIDLNWQVQWVGPRLQNLKILVCDSCRDVPQEQLRTFIIPSDPIPIDTPRVEDYYVEVTSNLSTEGVTDVFGDDSDQDDLTTEDGDDLIIEIEDTPTPDPDNPAIYP